MAQRMIYFDMDGVLADFAEGVRVLGGVEPADQNNQNRMSDDIMFEAIGKVDHFYRKLEPIRGTVDIFEELRGMYGDGVAILSAIPKPERGMVQAEGDKREWVAEHVGADVEVNIVLRKEKRDFASGDAILIDDTERNIREWEEAGGMGILFTDADSLRKKLVLRGILERRNALALPMIWRIPITHGEGYDNMSAYASRCCNGFDPIVTE